MKRASIDIGSNSVLLLAIEFDEKNNCILKEYLNESTITSLGKDLDKNKTFLDHTMFATFEALRNYKKLLEKNGFSITEVIVTATEASRVANNAKEFFNKVFNELGFKIQVINGKGEAYYTALGVITSLKTSDEKSIVVMDIGGASTELIKIHFNPFRIEESISMPIGSVRASDWAKEGSEVLDLKFNEIFKNDLSSFRTDTLVCVAGSMTALASMYLGHKVYDDQKIEGLEIPFNTFKDFARDLQNTSIENLLLLFPFLGKRAPMLGSGSKIAVEIGKILEIKKMKISTRGLRYGTVFTGGIHEQFIN